MKEKSKRTQRHLVLAIPGSMILRDEAVLEEFWPRGRKLFLYPVTFPGCPLSVRSWRRMPEMLPEIWVLILLGFVPNRPRDLRQVPPFSELHLPISKARTLGWLMNKALCRPPVSRTEFSVQTDCLIFMAINISLIITSLHFLWGPK